MEARDNEHVCNPSTMEAEAGEAGVQDPPWVGYLSLNRHRNHHKSLGTWTQASFLIETLQQERIPLSQRKAHSDSAKLSY